MKKIISLLVVTFLVTGCVPSLQISDAIKQYDAIAEQVQLGQSKEYALSVLLPTQESLPAKLKKRPEQYIKDGVKVEIYYIRSLHQSDGLTTDDEFIPYVFNDGKLVAIGWSTLGGPKTQGQTTPRTNVTVYN